MRRGVLTAALAAIGLVTAIFGDLTEDHRARAGGVAIVGAAILVAVTGWVLRRPEKVAQSDSRDWASYLAQSGEDGLLVVRPDQAQLYECAVRAFGADRVLYDRRQRERRRALSGVRIERRQSERRRRSEADFEIKAFGSAWISLKTVQ